jgi:hypothetical protein
MKKTKLEGPTRVVAQKAVERTENYKQAFTTVQGKAVLLDLLNEHYMLKTVYQGQEDSIGIAFRDGQRQVLLRILSIMQLDIGEIYMLLKEGDDSVRKK